MKSNHKSLLFKVVVNVFATSLLIMLLLGYIIFSQISVVTNALEKDDLLEQARKIASYIEYDWKGSFTLDLPNRYRTYYDEDEDGTHQYAVMNTSGRILFKSDDFMEEQIQNTLKEGGKHYFNFQTEDGRNFTGLKYDYLFEGKIYPIFILEHEAEFTKLLSSLEDDFLTKVLIYGTPLLLLQGLLIILIFRETFMPIFKAARDARNIKYDNLSYRLDEDNIHMELLPLIRSINNSLARLEKSAEQQKFFIANAAHELRTPISILKARISNLKDEKEVYALNEDLRNINRLIGQMLDISRLDLAEEAPKTEIDLNVIAHKACADMGPLFINSGKELSLEQRVKQQTIMGNEDILFRAILNLLENALKHTPTDTKVSVIIDDMKLTVRDHGKPIPEDYKDRIFERFEKTPDNTQTKGSGLGLAIVKKAAEIHGGSISVSPRKDGNDFILDFKAA
ncbi:MAG: HAMP domain-containing sensor histidine kinase [Pseudomonadota bacterium]|nr:HAMP domain-containing sensor histidine kinase [Pseudomonadota bacterium]MEC8664107.1 HAMP domain-containing sensor histidine kinase [Pseudomonadota bacterium]